MKEYKCKAFGWEYIFRDLGDEKYNAEIIPDRNISPPQSLFKLYGSNNYAVESLLQSYIYVNHPNQFNDVFDCHANIIHFDANDAIKVAEAMGYTEQKIREKLYTNRFNFINEIKHLFRIAVYKDWGICSMTSKPDSILMWSYYTNHSGFMIEFDYNKFPFEFYGPFPINYQEKMKQIPYKGNEVAGVLVQSNVKTDKWKHEDEWRLLIMPPRGQKFISDESDELVKFGGHDRKMSYPRSAIKNIVLGARFFLEREVKAGDHTATITLKENKERKAQIIDYIKDNNIPLELVLGNHRAFEIKTARAEVRFVDKDVYELFLSK